MEVSRPFLIETAVGTGTPGFAGDGGPAAAARLNTPFAMAVGPSGEVYIADSFNCRLRRFSRDGSLIATIAGTGVCGFSGDGGLAIDARLSRPYGIAVDAAENVYFSDLDNVRVRKVTAATGTISTVAGTGARSFGGDGGDATLARLAGPLGLAIGPDGDLYIADSDNYRIRRVSSNTGIITTVAGGGVGGDGSPAIDSFLSVPAGVAVDGSGNIFIADSGNHRIRKVDSTTGLIATIAGSGAYGFSGDGGRATDAKLRWPHGVALDSAGNVYVADSDNQRIRQVVAQTGTITTAAGNGVWGYAGDGGVATDAQFRRPMSIAVDAAGVLYIADFDNHRIRKARRSTPPIITSQPSPGNATAGQITSFTVAAAGDPSPTARWEVSSDSSTWFTIQGETGFTYSFTAAATDSGRYFRAVCSNVAGESASNAALLLVTVPPEPVVILNPTSQTVIAGNSAIFEAAASGTPTPTVQWQLSTNYGVSWSSIPGATATQYSFIAAAEDTAKQFRARFTNTLGTATTRTAALVVNVMPTVTLHPEHKLETAGSTTSFAAAANGSPAPTVQWYVSNDAGGTWTAVPGATSVSYSRVALIEDDGKRFRAVFTNAAGAVSSDASSLTVNTNPAIGVITTVAGGGAGGDGGTATGAALSYPRGVEVGPGGSLYIADTNGRRIRRVDAATGVITTVAGGGTAGVGDGGLAVNAQLKGPTAVAFDEIGNLYIADPPDHRLRVVTAADGRIWTIAGDGVQGFGGDGGAGSSARLSSPYAVRVDAVGDVYIADTSNNRIRVVALATDGTIRTVAGGGSQYGDGIPATASSLHRPMDIALDGSGNIYIADANACRIRRVEAASGLISTFAGGGSAGTTEGANATDAGFGDPTGVAVGPDGDVYVSDGSGNRIRKVLNSTGTIWTVAGNGQSGLSGDGGFAVNARLKYPRGIAVAGNGDVFIADESNQRVRRVAVGNVAPPIVARHPSDVTVSLGSPAVFSAAAVGTPGPSVQWQTSTDSGLTWLDIAGATDSFYQVSGSSSSDGSRYRARFSSSAGVAVSRPGRLSVSSQHRLSLTKAGTGFGSVASTLPAGIVDCGTMCAATFDEGTSVTLAATPAVESTFAGWSGGGCAGTGACTVTMTAATTLTATFTLNTYQLTVAKTGTGTGAVTSTSPTGTIDCGATCGAAVGHGTTVTLAATPAPESTFAGWSGGSCSGTGTCRVHITAATTVIATFTMNTHPLTVARVGTGAGTVASSSPGGAIDCGTTCGVTLDHGTTVTLTATPATGSTFAGWSGGGCIGTGDCTVMMTEAATLTATFTLNTYQLTVAKTGTGTGTVTSTSPAGTIDCGATCRAAVGHGTMVTLVATSAPESSFVGWSGGGCSGTGTCAVTLSAATTVMAIFDRQPTTFIVTPMRWSAPAAGGTVEVSVTVDLADAQWSATSTAVWLTASPSDGAGNATLTLTAAPNHTAGVRTGSLTIGGETLMVSQTPVLPPPVFTDEPLQARATAVRAVHVTELRQAIDGLRARSSLPEMAWTDAQVVPGSSMIRAAHILELRAALAAVYQAAGRAAPVFSPTTVDAGVTTITAAHVQELRNAVLGVW